MQKSSAGQMNVSIVRFGHETQVVSVPEGSTVDEVLATLSLELSGREEMFVEGQTAVGSDVLEEGDLLSIVTPKQAGALHRDNSITAG